MGEEIKTPPPVIPKVEDDQKKVEVVTPPVVPAKPVVPEKYDLKLKEGSTLDPSYLEGVSAYAKAKGLSNEDAQAVIDRDQENFSKVNAAQEAAAQKERDSWLPMAKTDKEFGGETFTKNIELAKRVVNRFGTDEFKKALDTTGLGNHPELLRVFVRIGQAMSEDQLIISNQPVVSGKKTAEQIMYPENK